MICEELSLGLSPLAVLARLADQRALAFARGIAGPHGSYTVLGWAPCAILDIRRDGATGAGFPAVAPDRVLSAVDRFLSGHPPPDPRVPFPIRPGALGYFAYELRSVIEPGPARARDDLGLPLVRLGWYDPLVVCDEGRRRYYVVSAENGRAVRDRRLLLLDRARGARPGAPRLGTATGATLESDMSRETYRRAVATILEYIRAGDVYQVNLTQRFQSRVEGDPLGLFLHLARGHGMPRDAYVDAGGFQVLCNSPELFLDRRGASVTTRPIKGTRPRGRHPEEDAALRAALCRDPKERAEHVMIVDLERNDLGRVCLAGSVRVSELARPHTFPTLHHLVSTVEGTLRGGTTAGDVLRATFPGGSVTGAPKIRATEIIDEIEPHARGVYTGALGLLDAAGDMSLSLPIRTAVVTGGTLYYGAGGGIVADSLPDAEFAECLLKVEGLLGALGLHVERAA
jgi:para-aminobenzoate synthetase component 1